MKYFSKALLTGVNSLNFIEYLTGIDNWISHVTTLMTLNAA